MSPVQMFSLVLLVLAFAVAIGRHMNVGLTTIPAGFVLCLVAGVPVDTYFTQFPGSLVVLILGVTLLFGHAQRSGAIDRLTELALGATGRRDWALPWIMFLLAAVLSGIGALPAASLAIVVPIAMRTAQLRRINLVLMGLVTISGALAGGFSPISVWGQLVVRLAGREHRPISSLGLFLIEFVLNLIVALVAFVIFDGLRLLRRPPGLDTAPPTAPSTEATGGTAGGGSAQAADPVGATGRTDPATVASPFGTAAAAPTGTVGTGRAGQDRTAAGGRDRTAAGDAAAGLGERDRRTVAVPDAAPGPAASPAATGTTAYQVTSLLGIAVFVATVLVFDVDVGLTAFSVALVLHVIHASPVPRPGPHREPRRQSPPVSLRDEDVLRGLPWSVVLVISGVLLYVGVLQRVGTLDAVSRHLGGIGNLGLAILALTFVGSLFASFESSSVAVLGLVIPVALHVTPGVSGVGLLLVLCAVCWAIVVASPSPYHVSGGLVLASSPESEQPALFRRLLLWTLAVAVVVPLIGWLLPTLGPA